MNAPKRIKYKGRIYEAVELEEEYSRDCCADNDDWDWGYTKSDIDRIEASSQYADSHPEENMSLEDMAKKYGVKL